MLPAALRPHLPEIRSRLRQRGVALLLTLLIEALILWLLFSALVTPKRSPSDPGLLTIDLRGATQAPRAAIAAHKSATRAKPDPVAPKSPKPLVEATKSTAPGFVVMSQADLDAGDISKVPSHRGEGGDTGTDSAAAYGPGQGPGGAPLYTAEWYREPTDGELELYLPPNRPPGAWAVIACQTVEKYHVENCRSLGESPPGSGLASGVRKAAWQFLVRPPRVGNKPLIGAWVRIRIDFTKLRETP